MEIEWREDKDQLKKGKSMRQLLETKVEERGHLSDALIYGLYVLGQIFFTISAKHPPESPIHAKVDYTKTKSRAENCSKRSILSESLPTPSSTANIATPTSNPSSTSLQGEILLALPSLGSDSSVQRLTQKSLRSKSEPEVSVGDRFLERLSEELLARRNSFGVLEDAGRNEILGEKMGF